MGLRAWRTRAAGGTVLLVLAAACRQLVGIGDGPPTADPDAGGAITYSGAQCEACLQASCAAQATACSGSPLCSALEGCLGQCSGVAACRARCLEVNPPGGDLLVAEMEACMVGNCSSQCHLTCGGVAEVAIPDAAPSCQACFESQGCAAARDCLSNVDCARFSFCFMGAPTPDQQAACSQLLDGGGDAAALASAAGSALINSCATECMLASNWSCLGRVTWPTTWNGNLTIQLTQLQDSVSSDFVGGVTVELCNATDLACRSPLATNTTDSTGFAPLREYADAGPINASGSYLDLFGGPDGGIVPLLYFWSYPLSEPLVTFNNLLTVTPAGVPDILPPGVTQDPSLAYVLVQGLDCLQFGGAGLRYTLEDPGASHVYYRNGDTQVLDPTLTQTDSSGEALFVNVPVNGTLIDGMVVGRAKVIASIAATGAQIGQFELVVRSGTVSMVVALPTPAD